MGTLQIAGTAIAVGAAALAFHLSWMTALAVGLILAMSSTAIALQTLGEKSLLKTPGGEASFAVLLFQDIAVIPILAILPLLAIAPSSKTGDEGALHGLPGWEKAL